MIQPSVFDVLYNSPTITENGRFFIRRLIRYSVVPRTRKKKILKRLVKENFLYRMGDTICVNQLLTGLSETALKDIPDMSLYTAVSKDTRYWGILPDASVSSPRSKFIGDVNERGLVYYLNPSPQTKKHYDASLTIIRESDMDPTPLDVLNIVGSTILKENLRDGWELLSAELFDPHIHPFTTKSTVDIVLTIRDTTSNKLKYRGVSCKSYNDTRYITMRNLGIVNFAKTFKLMFGRKMTSIVDVTVKREQILTQIFDLLFNEEYHKLWNFCFDFHADKWDLITNRISQEIEFLDGKSYYAPPDPTLHQLELVWHESGSSFSLRSPWYDRYLNFDIKIESKRKNKLTLVVKSVKKR